MPEPTTVADLDPELCRAVEAAAGARQRARAPYSRFRVGAAVLAADGRLVPGCNVEISSYSLTLCAERVALFAATAAGVGPLTAVAVVGPGDGGRPTPPCGACRQVIWELAGDCRVVLATPAGDAVVWQASELLPAAFDDTQMEIDP